MTFDNNIFAFQSCNNSELNWINSGIPLGKNVNHKNSENETKCPKLYNKDIDKNLNNANNCKYYTIDEFQPSKNMGNFNILHNNHGLENKFDVLIIS